ncbi:hypothetical protein CLIB1423_08S04676 [[Candida] railenensis]|uniref:Uncharacterized protein n=1 Tax=[Candida] railenensis TaxID=45579 RepID=A0A9P0VXV7_9ASCO|nr:hypothetical protein CLIB1423_08S04676 [[Candida] railenensis]
MSHIFQAGAVRGLTTALTAGTFVLEQAGMKDLLNINSSAATTVPLSQYPTPFFVRQDRKDKQKKVKVFGANGVQVYTIERLSQFHPVWTMLTFPERREVATINVGFTSRSVDFHNKPGMSHRDISVDFGWAGRFRSFYTTDGAKYSWVRGTKFLEKISNPNGGIEEVRQRVAKVKLMRQFKFDFEVLVDEALIDREVALATAFVSMFTQWGVGDATDTIGPTFIGSKPELEETQSKSDRNDIVVVIQGNEDDEISVETI